MEREGEDAAPQPYVASYNFNASGGDQVRETHADATETTTCARDSKSSLSLCLQLSFSSGDALLVHAKPSSEWWWAELRGVIGYVPASYLCPGGDAEEEDDTSTEDPWQDEEYFGSYGTLVGNTKSTYLVSLITPQALQNSGRSKLLVDFSSLVFWKRAEASLGDAVR